MHQVYDQIAHDFSRTRHSGWKFIEHFLEQLPAVRIHAPPSFSSSCPELARSHPNASFFSSRQGSLVLDAGCGNGKYLGCNSIIPAPNSNGTVGAWPNDEPKLNSTSPATPTAVETAQNDAGAKEGKGKGRILPIGWDMSNGLLGIAAGKGFETVRGDCFDLSCWRTGSFVRSSALSNHRTEELTCCAHRITPFLSLRSITLSLRSGEWSLSEYVRFRYP